MGGTPSKAMGDYGQYDVPPCEELLNFKVGQPAPSMLPLDLIRKAAAKKFEEDDPLYLQYGYISGYKKFRTRLAQFVGEHYKAEVDPEKLFVTNGVTGAISLICSLFTSSGDTVVTEEPSYFLALSIFQDFGLKVIQCPMDEDGMNMEKLEKILSENDVKMIYTVPTAHNPTGRALSWFVLQDSGAIATAWMDAGQQEVAGQVHELRPARLFWRPQPCYIRYCTSGYRNGPPGRVPLRAWCNPVGSC